MKKFAMKYWLETLTFIMFTTVTSVAVFMPEISYTRKILLGFMLLFTAHEWEENRLPGGFSKLMQKFSGKQFEKEREELSHIPVLVLLLVITFIPFVFDTVNIVVLIPIFLGVFECMLHIIGIFLHKTKKPYTPGLVTAVMLLALSMYGIYRLSAVALWTDYLFGAVCMIVSFAVMQRTVLMINGITYQDMISAAKKRFKKI